MKSLTEGERQKLNDSVKAATAVMTIRDLPDGKVEILTFPSGDTAVKMIKSGEPTTPAMGYLLTMVRLAADISKQMDPNRSKIIKPGKPKLRL